MRPPLSSACSREGPCSAHGCRSCDDDPCWCGLRADHRRYRRVVLVDGASSSRTARLPGFRLHPHDPGCRGRTISHREMRRNGATGQTSPRAGKGLLHAGRAPQNALACPEPLKPYEFMTRRDEMQAASRLDRHMLPFFRTGMKPSSTTLAECCEAGRRPRDGGNRCGC